MKHSANTSKANPKVDRYVFYVVAFIWIIIILFAITTLIQPVWLVEISKPGRRVESNASLEEGNKLMYAGKYKDAVVNYQFAFSVDSTNYDALGNMGIAFLYMGDYKNAEKTFLQLGDIFKNDYRIEIFYMNMGELYERKKQPEKAFEFYIKAIETGNGGSYIHRKAGYMAFLMGNDSLAIGLIQESVELTKSLEHYYDEAVFNAFQVANNDNDTANIRIFEAMLRNSSKTESMIRFDEHILDLWLQNSKDLGYAYLYLAEIMVTQNRLDEARTYAAQCRRYAPDLNSKLIALNANL